MHIDLPIINSLRGGHGLNCEENDNVNPTNKFGAQTPKLRPFPSSFVLSNIFSTLTLYCLLQTTNDLPFKKVGKR